MRHALLAGAGFVAAAIIGFATWHTSKKTGPVTVVAADDAEICLGADIAFLPGDQTGCIKRSRIAEWEKAPLIDAERGPLVISMSHPTDVGRDAVACTTCSDFKELRLEGWYASTSREMRREALFVRACSVIGALRHAQAAEISYFDENGLEPGDVASLAADKLLHVGADPAVTPGDPEIARTGPSSWRISAGDQTVRVDEVALADFDGDDIAEILALFFAGPDRATARITDMALLEKDAASAALAVTPIGLPTKNGAKKGI